MWLELTRIQWNLSLSIKDTLSELTNAVLNWEVSLQRYKLILVDQANFGALKDDLGTDSVS
jgi:hypothetical protein